MDSCRFSPASTGILHYKEVFSASFTSFPVAHANSIERNNIYFLILLKVSPDYLIIRIE